MFVSYWDLVSDAFMLDGQPLRVEVDGIYFLTGLSQWGEIASFKARNIGGMTIEEYIASYCARGTQKVGSQILMAHITRLDLRIILATIQRIVGYVASHQVSCIQMFYAVRCLNPTIYDLCTTLLGCIEAQLTFCKEGKTHNFGFGSVLCSLFFERVPGLSPRF